MARDPIPTWYFALVVVRSGNRFLIVHETKHGQKWFLPAGRVEPGETFVEAAHRETMEEAGIPIVLEGLLKLQHTPGAAGTRVRAIFLARPADATSPRTTPNEHSLEARWATVDELARLPMRGPEVEAIFRWVEQGATAHPLDLLGREDE